MRRKLKMVLLVVLLTFMLIFTKSQAQDFRLGVFKGHVSLRMDHSVDSILTETNTIHWYAENEVMKNEYKVDYNFKSRHNRYQFEFLSKKEFKRFRKKNGPIVIEFLDQDNTLLYSARLYAYKGKDVYTGRSDFWFDFEYLFSMIENRYTAHDNG